MFVFLQPVSMKIFASTLDPGARACWLENVSLTKKPADMQNQSPGPTNKTSQKLNVVYFIQQTGAAQPVPW